MKAQASLEFLIMFSMILLIFAFSVFTYYQFVDQGSTVRSALEANRICNQVASGLGTLSSLKGNATYRFNLPATVNYNNYTIHIFSLRQYVRVDYGTAGAGCNLQTKAITNSTGSTIFVLNKNATVVSNGGALVAYP
jgi:uncharacterized protein (UPF0333 family)